MTTRTIQPIRICTWTTPPDGRHRLMVDLHHHGDSELAPGMLDLAVNVRPGPPPWLASVLRQSLTGLAAYPDAGPATTAVAARHGRDPDEVLLTAGAAEAFVLLARALRPTMALCVHPGFTEPEAALRAAGHPVTRHLLAPPYELAELPADADLVVLGNPTNPTGVLHMQLERLCRPGRIVVVDEAFMDAVPEEHGSLAARRDLPGLVVVRSLTKTWGLAGLRVGYLLAEPELVARLRAAQPLWSVSTPALAAAAACSTRTAVAEAGRYACMVAAERRYLTDRLGGLGVRVVARSQAPFLLCAASGHPYVRDRLRSVGIAVRRGDTFPGLTSEHWRTAVRDRAASDRLLMALWSMLCAA